MSDFFCSDCSPDRCSYFYSCYPEEDDECSFWDDFPWDYYSREKKKKKKKKKKAKAKQAITVQEAEQINKYIENKKVEHEQELKVPSVNTLLARTPELVTVGKATNSNKMAVIPISAITLPETPRPSIPIPERNYTEDEKEALANDFLKQFMGEKC